MPPEKYGPGGLDEAALGPFPTFGDYEDSFWVERPSDGGFVQLTCGIAREVVRRVLASERYSDWQRIVAAREREERRERNADRVRHDIFSDSNQLYTGSYTTVPKEIT